MTRTVELPSANFVATELLALPGLRLLLSVQSLALIGSMIGWWRVHREETPFRMTNVAHSR